MGKINKPFLDIAIKRGDDFVIATKPIPENLFRDGKLSGFGRDIKYLKSKGYVCDAEKLKMIRRE